MGRKNYFQFKQFRIEQVNSAMKVGVDSVLLGAWTDVSNAHKILDVGTGTGLIALMLTQRSQAKIIAVEIEENAAKEATKNVAESIWNDRIDVNHISFQQFLERNTEKFDLIVSNPPYFGNSHKAASYERTLARHNDNLTLKELIQGVTKILNPTGTLALIIPVMEIRGLQNLLFENRLFFRRWTEIKPKPSKPANRVLLQIGKTPTEQYSSALTIYNNDNSFTEAYKELTRDFYLKF